ncbi:uncharacterized protein [Nicotiana sylvestris]|uniref:uncharacterized protein isoform X2 n=1 Tax=Nicotiana sylvestris TaxID=4096 RepID=UPI00388C6ECD
MEKKDTGKVSLVNTYYSTMIVQPSFPPSFSTEKATSEGLPPRWIKEMRVRRKGHKIKKDPLTAEADKHISLDRDASGKEVNSNHKLKLGAEHMAHSSCVEGIYHPLKNAEEEDDGKVVSDPVSGENQENPSRDGVEKHDQETIHRKRKKGMNLPRRNQNGLLVLKLIHLFSSEQIIKPI